MDGFDYKTIVKELSDDQLRDLAKAAADERFNRWADGIQESALTRFEEVVARVKAAVGK
jgi:3-methyladenine DNA glycosylase AlkD